MKVTLIGGGVIGLSLAWELANRQHTVTVIERHEFGRKASWAGAGILLPGNAETAIHPMEHLEAASNRLHANWAVRLRDTTGIDTGYRQCGGLYVATTPGEIATLAGSMGYWAEREIKVVRIAPADFADRYPALSQLAESKIFSAAWMPEEAQICNPWHLKALVAACEQRGVRMLSGVQDLQIKSANGKVISLDAANQSIDFDVCVFACGAWTQQVASQLFDGLQLIPVRGQMVLYRLAQPLNLPIINEGTRYIVPRTDGHVLVGATIEEVGFDETTSEAGVAKLKRDAQRLVPDLTPDRVVKTWAGLRPGSHDAFPYMGRIPGFENAFVSTGHFKIGLQLSTGSAVAMADLIEARPTLVDLTPFDPSRVLI